MWPLSGCGDEEGPSAADAFPTEVGSFKRYTSIWL